MPVASLISTTAEYGLMNNQTSLWNWNVTLQLFADNILDSVVSQQDGAPPHFAYIVRNYLNETFPGRWIERGSPRFWAARLPDLTPLDFFAWGHIKTPVYKVKIRELEHLRERVSAAVHTITPAMSQRVSRCTEERWQLCLDMEGNHIEFHLIILKNSSTLAVSVSISLYI